MNIQVVGCSHHETPIGVRERLAFSHDQVCEALGRWRHEFAQVEAVLLSTCNRVEVYAATENAAVPSASDVAGFLARFHGAQAGEIECHLYQFDADEAVGHLFAVAASLDSMVLGEPQILAQVKQAYQIAAERDSTGPLMHAAFQTAVRVARRVANETAVHQRRVSIPSVAVADFAGEIFERLDDKHTLVIGAGEMAEETIRYLQDAGAHRITVVNRSAERAAALAERWHGRPVPFSRLDDALVEADLVVSTTGSEETVVGLDRFLKLERRRESRLLFVLDLAVPRDFDPAIAERPDVYLYSVDDLQAVCDRNRRERDRELPDAMRIIEKETARFMGDLHHRATGPVIQRLKQGWQGPKEEELRRLLAKLPELDQRAQAEVRHSFDRLVNKLLHPPLESLRDESRHGMPTGLVDALKRLFQLKD